MMWVKLTLPPRLRDRWLLRILRLTSSSRAGTTRKLVAVGTARLASMLATIRAAAPRIGWLATAGTAAAGLAGAAAGLAAAAAGLAGAAAGSAVSAGAAPAVVAVAATSPGGACTGGASGPAGANVDA